VRATGTEVSSAMLLAQQVRQLGMPLYGCQPPTGYKDSADAWVNTGALVNRMNIALALSTNQMRGIRIDPVESTGDSDSLIAKLVNGEVSVSTRATIARAATKPQVAALTLGSPEFQRK
jgi:uncharacterized protein (DUF1800 family)